MTGSRKKYWEGYTYANNYPWQKNKSKGLSDISFMATPSKDGVVVIKTSDSLTMTRYFRTVKEFRAMRDQLQRAMDEVILWNDIEVPDTSFSIPISVVCNMGSLRCYLRGNIKVLRLSRHHCEQLIYMFDSSMQQLDEWDEKMREIFGDKFIAMPRE